MNYYKDIMGMHYKYKTKEVLSTFDSKKLKDFLDFRIKFLREELKELETSNNADDVVDALIDLTVVAIGTLDLFDVDVDKAWSAVLEANMNKIVGMKETRKNTSDFPDLIKPHGWKPPSHVGNTGKISIIYGE